MISSLLESAAGALSASGLGLFGYSRENYKYDRRQRVLMEYQLADMRIKQTQLWREDVRDFMELTPRKMDVYLLVIALELNATATALCKARVPPGAPSWLCDCHTLAVVSALVYLMLALWYGLHAFVSATAYKVRILTQIVRLPIPTWEQMEAARTYNSTFEQQPRNQMLRVPFVEGTQESRCRATTVASGSGVAGAGGGSPASAGVAPSDPWGLERSGRDIRELQPGVNERDHTARQQHIWHVREAGRFYQTYDAFCRISMSAGTSSLATFFSFFCLSYVLTENAAPVAAWAGMLIFVGISLILLSSDLKVTRPQLIKAAMLLAVSPLLCSIVTFVSSKNAGKPREWEWLMPIALFCKGAWFLYYLELFRVRELETGAQLPTAFNGVLYIDPFGWAKHSMQHWRKAAQKAASRVSMPRGTMQDGRGSSTWRRWFRSRYEDDAAKPKLPSMMFPGVPSRPEDVSSAPAESFRTHDPTGMPYVSFRPNTFTGTSAEEEHVGNSRVETGADIHGDTPGLVPWRYFYIITITIASLWWVAAGVSAWTAYFGMDSFVMPQYGLGPREVAPVPLLISQKLETSWQLGALERPRGLACDAAGSIFVTLGRSPDGIMSLLQGQLSAAGAGAAKGAMSVRFEQGSPCSALEADGVEVQDLAIGDCGLINLTAGGSVGCTASVLPRGGASLLRCRIRQPLSGGLAAASTDTVPAAMSQLLGRAWLEDRGGESSDDEETDGLLQPEEMSALSSVPCTIANRAVAAGGRGESGECFAVGTTARRLVLLGAPTTMAANAADTRPLVPKRLLKAGHAGLHGAGAIALFGGHYLSLLDQATNALHVLDLHNDGKEAGVWGLPTHSKWASICAGSDAFYALEEGDEPGLWRFDAPKELLEM